MQVSQIIKMKRVLRLTKRYPLSAFFFLTFAISWISVFLVMGTGGMLGSEEISESLMPFVYLATLLGPVIAGILLIAIVDGKSGFKDFSSRLFKWKIAARWYAVALLIAPIFISIILFGFSMMSQSFLPTLVNAENKPGLLLTGIVMGLLVGFFEEVGWTGFAVPKLLQRYGVLTTGLIVGFFWGFWHLPLFLGNVIFPEKLPAFLYLFVLLFSFLPVYRVLMVWVYEITGSLLLAVLMHMPLAASQLILIPSTISEWQIIAYDLVFALSLWSIVFALLVANDWKLGRNVN